MTRTISNICLFYVCGWKKQPLFPFFLLAHDSQWEALKLFSSAMLDELVLLDIVLVGNEGGKKGGRRKPSVRLYRFTKALESPGGILPRPLVGKVLEPSLGEGREPCSIFIFIELGKVLTCPHCHCTFHFFLLLQWRYDESPVAWKIRDCFFLTMRSAATIGVSVHSLSYLKSQ